MRKKNAAPVHANRAAASEAFQRPGVARDNHFISNKLGRRSFLRHALAGIGGFAASSLMLGCSSAPQPTVTPTATPDDATAEATSTGSKILLVYFSRAGENYYYGGRTQLKVGNTEVLAGKISQRITCDVYRIEAADPYSDDYRETVERNVQEQNADARPAIANPLDSMAAYDTVLLASPIWNVRAPMIMSTFAESFDFTGKTLFPVTTYAMSGLGTTVRDYTALCPGATIGEGLAVQGEKVVDADAAVEAWLKQVSLLTT